jgi:ZIP family zinc transporter
MTALFMSFIAVISTVAGGLTALHNRFHLNRIMGFTAGVLLGVVAFNVLPEMFNLATKNSLDTTWLMVALVVGFLLFHILEKSILLHHGHENQYGKHKHPHVGLASALALSGHSFLDGVGIGLGFQINTTVGIAVTIAVIAHDFADGLNTVSLMLHHKNNIRSSMKMLALDAVAPVLGVISTFFFSLSPVGLALYLGFFAGFLLYIGASDILPQAHSEESSRATIGMTILGVAFIFIVTRFV